MKLPNLYNTVFIWPFAILLIFALAVWAGNKVEIQIKMKGQTRVIEINEGVKEITVIVPENVIVNVRTIK
jgi:hypothetical protein